MFFRLLPEVYLTIGKKKSLLQNILNKKSLWINNDIASLLAKSEKNEVLKENFEIFETLSRTSWGILSEKPIFIDKLRLENVFNDKKFFKNPPIIHSAILKLTDKCNLNCESCKTNFCPICFQSGISESTNLSLKHWKDVVLNLYKFGCRSIMLTGGEVSLYPELNSLYKFILDLDILPTICTNGKNSISLNKNAHIIITVNNIKDINFIINNFKDFKSITLLTYSKLNDQIKKNIPSTWKYLNSSLCVPEIKKENLSNPDVYEFFARKNRNKCLNNKIAILENGDVYPCFGAYVSSLNLTNYCYDKNVFDEDILISKCLGNIKEDKWIKIVDKLVKNFWEHKVDNNVKCRSCEFRYNCNSCLFSNVSKKCFYDVEKAVWK